MKDYKVGDIIYLVNTKLTYEILNTYYPNGYVVARKKKDGSLG